MFDLPDIILDCCNAPVELVLQPFLDCTQIDRVFDDHGVDWECVEIDWNEKWLSDRKAHDLFEAANDPLALGVAALRWPIRRLALVGHCAHLLSRRWKTTISRNWNACNEVKRTDDGQHSGHVGHWFNSTARQIGVDFEKRLSFHQLNSFSPKFWFTSYIFDKSMPAVE